ncbi:MAG: lipoprotein signal peptidase [Betaproteobacteria bacterium]|nr:lipoprotein signal peptidase [Betaproteobacteria bacterium]
MIPEQIRLLRWLALGCALACADQASKWFVLERWVPGERVSVIDGWFDITLVFNRGAAFSFLADQSGWQRWFFTGLGTVAAVVMVWLLHSNAGEKLFCFAISCVLGGAVGNVIDRVLYGYVVDFLDFHWMAMHFPAFNAADSAITLGATCLILDELLRVRRSR